jgi:hypothetical protein
MKGLAYVRGRKGFIFRAKLSSGYRPSSPAYRRQATLQPSRTAGRGPIPFNASYRPKVEARVVTPRAASLRRGVLYGEKCNARNALWETASFCDLILLSRRILLKFHILGK